MFLFAVGWLVQLAVALWTIRRTDRVRAEAWSDGFHAGKVAGTVRVGPTPKYLGPRDPALPDHVPPRFLRRGRW
ncbi:hypothetical protein ASF35_16415 [Aeromicrobium sp. Leaf291]|nr:hypothetical protein ASF35_16415 [Aeromicrobium sp. Leaf291]